MHDAVVARSERKQDLGFSPRDFVLCGLPLKRQVGTVYKRRNGNLLLKVVADPDAGLPFGQDRLLPIWLATAFKVAGEPEDNTIRFRSAHDILRAFELPNSGLEFRRLAERFAGCSGLPSSPRISRLGVQGCAQRATP